MQWDVIPEADRVRPMWEKLLDSGRLPHALIWVGKEGIGKTALAWAATQSLLCERATPPCSQCPACQKVKHLTHPNLYIIAPTTSTIASAEASQRLAQALLQNPFLSLSEFQTLLKAPTLTIGVEAVRQLISTLLLTPAEKTWRIVWFWHAETLTRQAANALLKIVEEPPNQTLFIFLTTRLEALPITIRSRSQVWHIPPLSEKTLLSSVEGAHNEKEAHMWVRLSEGSLSRLRQLQEPTWQELLRMTRLWLSACLNPHLVQDWGSLLDNLQRHALLSEALQLSLTLIREHPALSLSQQTYAMTRLLEALDALSANLQPAIVLSHLTSDLLQNWKTPPLTWEFLLSG